MTLFFRYFVHSYPNTRTGTQQGRIYKKHFCLLQEQSRIGQLLDCVSLSKDFQCRILHSKVSIMVLTKALGPCSWALDKRRSWYQITGMICI